MYYENIVGHHCVFDEDGSQIATFDSKEQALAFMALALPAKD